MAEQKRKEDGKDLLNKVRNQVQFLIESKFIHVPKNYSVENALQSAWFIISELTYKEKQGTDWVICKTLDAVTTESVANSMFKMIVEGLNPYKSQCSFIKRKNELTYSREYPGSIALAKRYSGVIDVRAREVFKEDEYVTEVQSDSRMTLKKHVQNLKSRTSEVIGAYCVVIEKDGKESLVEMTIQEIKASWKQGTQFREGGDGVHQKFTGEMVKKTVTNRACKAYINASDDTAIMEHTEKETDTGNALELENPQQKTLEIPEENKTLELKEESNTENQKAKEEVPY